MKHLILIIMLICVLIFGLVHIFFTPSPLHADYKLCNDGPQCHDGMTSCGPGLTCKCIWGWCVKKIPK